MKKEIAALKELRINEKDKFIATLYEIIISDYEECPVIMGPEKWKKLMDNIKANVEVIE